MTTEPSPAPSTPITPDPQSATPARKRDGSGSMTKLKVIITIAILAGVVGFFKHSARGHTGNYKMVDEVMLSHGQFVGKPMKIHGWVEAGSINEQIVAQETVRTFVLEHKGKRILVRNKGPKPDSFRDKSEVVAEGTIIEENGQPIVVADNLMAKCPSKYEGAPQEKLFD